MLNKENIEASVNAVVEDVNCIENMITEVVNSCTKDMDVIMENIYKEVVSVELPAIVTIEKYFLELSHCIYTVSESCERIGMFDSISKAKAQETYNMKYLEHQHSNDGQVGAKKPTVAESTAEAESSSIYDKTVSDMYSRAYKIVKNKLDAAGTMVNTLSKIYYHRVQESQAVKDNLNRQLLNEGNPF